MKLSKALYNWTSVLGASIVVIGLFLIGFFFTISMVFDQGGSYLGLLIYILLPMFMGVGLLLIPIGMFIEIRRDRKTHFPKEEKWPHINLNDRQHRTTFLIFITVTTVFLFLSSVGSYEAFHYTESNEFCGLLCHTVMEPEYIAYEDSPHARVKCVECHVGPGASWYVRSKLSGLYQAYSVTFDKYARPIETPIHNLRPARETCEKCHWPQKFYTQRIINEKYYLTDENNTEWNLQLLMKTGPDHQSKKLSEGIHWHINPNVKIEYYPSDESNEFIPWVKYTNSKTGEEYIYVDEENQPDSAIFVQGNAHLMDCMDCHNRPSHGFLSPSNYIDNSMAAGLIPKDLKYIKAAAMETLVNVFPNKDSADLYIESNILNYYTQYYPEIAEENGDNIMKSIKEIKNAYHTHTFPHMNVRWDAYPDHIGHLESSGCFRCHDNKHKTAEGRIISKECKICHDITAQGTKENMQAALPGNTLEFQHPVDIGTDWQDYACSECHAALY